MSIREVEVPQVYAPVIVRSLRRDDLAACHRIDRQACGDIAWSEADWYDRYAVTPALVAVQGAVVAGFVVYELKKACVEIQKIAVHPRVYRSGVGTTLVTRILDIVRLHSRRFAQITVPLDPARVPALLFLKSLGWVGYLETDGSAVAMVKENRRK